MKHTVAWTSLALVLLYALLGDFPRARAGAAQSGFVSSVDSAETTAYVNGRIWNGEHFTARPLFVRGGQFVGPDAQADTTIDLQGGYVVPPFGDAHNHAFADSTSATVFADSLYLRNGVFYALSLTVPYSGAQKVQSRFEDPATLDVAYAYGGITSTGRHPAPAMERVYGDEDAGTQWTLAGDAYWFMDTRADVQKKWSEYLAHDPDVVKVYIIHSGDDNGRGECGYGLCPEVVREIVARAHDAGKRVFAHVNTAEDVRRALAVGVDALAHLPLGNDGISIDEADPYRLRAETIERAGEQNVILTPTASLLAEDLDTFRPDTLQAEIALQRTQLRRLHRAGARIALGTDGWSTNPLREAMYLNAYEVFDNRTLLNLWSRTTPQSIFPNRKIGHLEEGYEASFLVLGDNPLENFEAVRNIRRTVKEGHTLADPDA